MKAVFTLVLFCAVSAFGQLPVEPKCTAIVTKNVEPIAVLQFDLARCEDIEFKGGGIVVRHITNKLTGAWSIRYFPAHQVKSVSVTPKEGATP